MRHVAVKNDSVDCAHTYTHTETQKQKEMLKQTKESQGGKTKTDYIERKEGRVKHTLVKCHMINAPLSIRNEKRGRTENDQENPGSYREDALHCVFPLRCSIQLVSKGWCFDSVFLTVFLFFLFPEEKVHTISEQICNASK